MLDNFAGRFWAPPHATYLFPIFVWHTIPLLHLRNLFIMARQSQNIYPLSNQVDLKVSIKQMSLVTLPFSNHTSPVCIFPQPIPCKGEKGTLLTFLRLNNNRVFARNRICIQEANIFGRWAAKCEHCEHYMLNDNRKEVDSWIFNY